mmetsp:Transcript_122078/g.345245  ORF Transcript_122078/g.345245 Transcript_122078/m.345245 type:complete len:282 (+) Transcript_122078:827-1672(+)
MREGGLLVEAKNVAWDGWTDDPAQETAALRMWQFHDVAVLLQMRLLANRDRGCRQSKKFPRCSALRDDSPCIKSGRWGLDGRERLVQQGRLLQQRGGRSSGGGVGTSSSGVGREVVLQMRYRRSLERCLRPVERLGLLHLPQIEIKGQRIDPLLFCGGQAQIFRVICKGSLGEQENEPFAIAMQGSRAVVVDDAETLDHGSIDAQGQWPTALGPVVREQTLHPPLHAEVHLLPSSPHSRRGCHPRVMPQVLVDAELDICGHVASTILLGRGCVGDGENRSH